MIYIKKSKDGQFFVDAEGGNNEKLHHTENVKAKASAWKNIAATARAYGSADSFYVTDLSLKRVISYRCLIVGKKLAKSKIAR